MSQEAFATVTLSGGVVKTEGKLFEEIAGFSLGDSDSGDKVRFAMYLQLLLCV